MINEHALKLILDSEGGYKEDSDEPGGASYTGISQAAYREWKEKKCKITDAPDHVKALGGSSIDGTNKLRNPLILAQEHPEYNIRTDIIIAFYTDYFEKYRADLLPECLQFIYLDFATNAGSGAVKAIQKLVNCEADGKMGPGTRKAMEEWTTDFEERLINDVYADNDAIDEYDQYKAEHYAAVIKENPKLAKYEKGWKNRRIKVKAELAEYYDDDNPTPSSQLDHEEKFFEEDQDQSSETLDVSVSSEADERISKLEEQVANLTKMLEQFLNKKEEPVEEAKRKFF